MSFALRFVATLVVVIAFSYASIGLNAWRTIARSLAPHAGTLQALAQAEATRTTATKWNGALPGSVSLWWLPEGVTSFLKSMVQRP
jgi:hypothetical protein